MSKEKPFEQNIESFYKKCAIDYMLFAWVECLKNNLPAVSQRKAIDNFKKYMNIAESDYPTDSALVIYNRLKTDFFNTLKTKT